MRQSGTCILSITSLGRVVSTPRPKLLAVMFILGAFLTGGAVGFATARAVSPPRPGMFSDRSMVDELARELKLSPAQRLAIDSIWDWRRRQSREIMKTVRPSLDAARDSSRALIMNRLDASQQTTFRGMIDRYQRSADSSARARGDSK